MNIRIHLKSRNGQYTLVNYNHDSIYVSTSKIQPFKVHVSDFKAIVENYHSSEAKAEINKFLQTIGSDYKSNKDLQKELKMLKERNTFLEEGINNWQKSYYTLKEKHQSLEKSNLDLKTNYRDTLLEYNDTLRSNVDLLEKTKNIEYLQESTRYLKEDYAAKCSELQKVEAENNQLKEYVMALCAALSKLQKK